LRGGPSSPQGGTLIKKTRGDPSSRGKGGDCKKNKTNLTVSRSPRRKYFGMSLTVDAQWKWRGTRHKGSAIQSANEKRGLRGGTKNWFSEKNYKTGGEKGSRKEGARVKQLRKKNNTKK